jgi:hypothetical protein
VDTWLAQFRRFWSAHVDALERHLDRMEQDRLDQDRMNPPMPKKSASLKKKKRKATRPSRERDKGETK